MYLRILFITACITFIIIAPQIKNIPEFKYVCDAKNYIAMAEGCPEEVPMYDAGRILHPLVVNKLRTFTGTDCAFLVVGTGSLFVFLLIVLTALYYKIRLPLAISALLIFSYHLFVLYHDLYIQTIFFIALSSIYWLLLLYKRYLLSFVVLFLLLLTRDEAVIILFSFILAVLLHMTQGRKRRLYYLYILTAFLIGGAGCFIIMYNMRNNSNIHNMPALFFYFIRIPFWTIRNFAGFALWVDTYRGLPSYVHNPIMVFDAPAWLRSISVIKQIGIYNWGLSNILRTLLFISSVFGTGPTILLYFLKNKTIKIVDQSLAFTAMLFSGSIIFVSAFFIGPPLSRYYFNAWPLFFLIMPLYLKSIYHFDKRTLVRIMCCYAASAWLYTLTLVARNLIVFLSLILFEIALHLYTWGILSAISKKIDYLYLEKI